MSLRLADDSMVYLVEDVTTGAVKIGITKRLRNRLRALQAQTNHPLRLVAASQGDGEIIRQRLERSLHGVFSESRQRGEWFSPSPLLQRIVRTNMQAELYVGDLTNDHHKRTLRAFHLGRLLTQRDGPALRVIDVTPEATTYWGEWFDWHLDSQKAQS